MKQILILTILILTLFSLRLNAQTVRNVNFTVQGNDIQITYDLLDNGKGEKYYIELYYSTDNGIHWKGPINKDISGDIGRNISFGNSKKILWQPLLTLSWLYSDYVMFKVVVTSGGSDYIETASGLNLEMIFVEGGTFEMGCTPEQSDCEDDEKPVHTVRVDDFYIGKYEVTYGQFKEFIDATSYKSDADKGNGSYIWNGSSWEMKSGVNWRCDVNGNTLSPSEYNHPVIHVSWNDATEYCDWLSKQTGEAYRLPREAEWEYAARGEATTTSSASVASAPYKYSGSNNIDKVAWYDDNSGSKTHPVGQKQANELGIYDMSGNVWEWCSDWYGSYGSGSQTNPVGAASGSYRVLRGGSWYNDASNCRVSNRGSNNPGYRNNIIGFRLVLSSD